jgi:uncharacterized RDD family membrane protein YckC
MFGAFELDIIMNPKMAVSTHHVAGFTTRLVAIIVDTIVLFPLAVLLGKLMQYSKEVALPGAVAYGLMYPLYNILLLGLLGQTIGKKVAGIRVEMVEGSSITWKGAFLRHVMDLLFVSILICGWIAVLSDPAFVAVAHIPRFYTLLKPKQSIFVWTGRLWTAWIWSELIVMLLNKKKRALHDFIAGTWVVHTRVAESQAPSVA